MPLQQGHQTQGLLQGEDEPASQPLVSPLDSHVCICMLTVTHPHTHSLPQLGGGTHPWPSLKHPPPQTKWVPCKHTSFRNFMECACGLMLLQVLPEGHVGSEGGAGSPLGTALPTSQQLLLLKKKH